MTKFVKYSSNICFNIIPYLCYKNRMLATVYRFLKKRSKSIFFIFLNIHAYYFSCVNRKII